MRNEDSCLIKYFTNANISTQEPPKYLLGSNWYDILQSEMSVWGWTRRPSMEDILREFRKIEYKQLQSQYQSAKAFVKRITVYGWSNSGQVALTIYRIKLHSKDGIEYICW